METHSAFGVDPKSGSVIPDGWEVVEKVAMSLVGILDLKYVSFLDTGETFVSGQTMRERAATLKAIFGLYDALYLIEHQDKIPQEVQGKYLVFPGHLLLDGDGNLRVPMLYSIQGRWYQSFHPLDDDGWWNSSVLLVRG